MPTRIQQPQFNPNQIAWLEAILRARRLTCNSTIGEYVANETKREILDKIRSSVGRT
jgi:hypothetical protein